MWLVKDRPEPLDHVDSEEALELHDEVAAPARLRDGDDDADRELNRRQEVDGASPRKKTVTNTHTAPPP